MEKESKLSSAVQSSAVQSSDHKQQWRQRTDPAETPLILPNPFASDQSLRGSWTGVNVKQSPLSDTSGDASGSRGYRGSRHVRETSDGFLQRDKSTRDPQAKTSKNSTDSPAQRKVSSRTSLDAQKKGFRGARSAPNSAGKSKPAQPDLAPFEVKMTDFPELSGVSLGKPGPPVVQRERWGPTQPERPQTQTSASPWKSGTGGSAPQAANVKPDSSAASPEPPVMTSWANIASQPPKKPAPPEQSASRNHMQTEEIAAQQEDGAPGKRKRKKKKKKAKGAGEDAEAEAEVSVYQEPPRFQDEEEFPGLTLSGMGGFTMSSSAAKLCNEDNQREVAQHPSADPTKEKSPTAKPALTEAAKKGQKAEKVSGKKSKVPFQLDIGNMLATLEKKQQSQKTKQDAKPVILSVGGGLPVVQKQPVAQKKPPWQQDKIAHNPLDSTSPLVKKGKQREVPKAKKPTPLKKVILKEREERKQRRLLEERGLLPENEDAAAEEQCDANITDEVGSPTEECDEKSEMIKDETVKDESDGEENVEQQTTSPVPCPVSRPKIHSRKFRDYCSQMLSKEVDECVTALLKELVRFQDRLYQKDPMKARMKRRIVMGLREVLKHLKLRKVKCVIFSPNCERVQSKGGLDEALYTIINTCREQGVPFVFALSRKALGRCVNKAVPVSLVGIFNYDGAQDLYHKMIELSSEARTAYEMMVLSLEQMEQTGEEQAENTEKELQISSLAEEAEPGPDTTQPDEPEYIKLWKKMLEKEYNHKLLNFEEQLSSMCLEDEFTENTDEDEKS